MDEQIKERLVRYLDSVEGSIEKAVDFTSDQVPLYVQELCQFGAFKYGFAVASLTVAVVVLTVIYSVVMYKLGYVKDDDRWFARMMSTMIWFVISAGICIGVTENAVSAYKCMYCPRVYVVEQIRDLTR